MSSSFHETQYWLVESFCKPATREKRKTLSYNASDVVTETNMIENALFSAMFLPIGINDLINEIKRLGYNFSLILRKEAGSEPLVLGSIPLQEARDIIDREMLPAAQAEDQGDVTQENLQHLSQLRTSAAGTSRDFSPSPAASAPREEASPSPAASAPREEASPSPAASAPPEMAPLIRDRCQRVRESDTDDDFVRPGAAPPRPAKETVTLYHSLPELDVSYDTVTASRKKSFAAQLLKARIIMYYFVHGIKNTFYSIMF